ncbi:MAG: DUF2760 domain-containing protein [Candidatus Wallbacteria bacterium]
MNLTPDMMISIITGIVAGFAAAIVVIKTRKTVKSEEKRADAVQLLGLLQEKGRLIDFLMEDIKGYDDAQVGSAVRNIHDECRKILNDYFPLKPVINVSEGDKYEVSEGFDPSEIKLTGNVGSKPPFKGTVQHSGWVISEIKLAPKNFTGNNKVVAPAEIEIS